MAASTKLSDYLGVGLAAARPATPPIGTSLIAFYYATDTSALSVYANGAWSAVGAGSGTAIDQYSPPAASAFTAGKFTGDATAVTLSDVAGLGMVIDSGLGSGTGGIIRGCMEAKPGATYTISARLRVSKAPYSFRCAGIGISDGTKYIFMGYTANSSTEQNLQIGQQNSTSSFNTSALNVNARETEYLRIKQDGTHRTYYVSEDGRNWADVYQEATTNFLTETEVGFVTQPFQNDTSETNRDHIYMAVPWWTATTP